MAIVLQKTDSENLLFLEGAIDIGCAAELKTALLEAFPSATAVAISLAGVESLDVTAVQLIWAARSHADRLGLRFRFRGEIPAAVEDALAGMGLASFQTPVQAG